VPVSIAVSSLDAFTAAVAGARTVDFAAYLLRDGAVLRALVGAARAGAQVRVRLERAPLEAGDGVLQRAGRGAIAALTAAGADAAPTSSGEPVLHIKAAVVDGVAWLDDRNWAGSGSETVVRDSDRADVAALGAALGGIPGDAGSPGALSTTKAAAQGRELEVFAAAGGSALAVESESFGNGRIYDALLARGRAGAPTRLLVAGREAAEPSAAGERERRLLARLEGLGVDVRTGDPHGRDFAEKLALAPAGAWIGSANATYAHGAAGEQRDWGLVTGEIAVVDRLRAAFEANWRAACPLGDGTLTGAKCALPSATTSAIRPPVPNFEPRSTSASTSR